MDTKFHRWKRGAINNLKEEYEINDVTASRLYVLWENCSPVEQRSLYACRDDICWCGSCFPLDILEKVDPVLYNLIYDAGAF